MEWTNIYRYVRIYSLEWLDTSQSYCGRKLAGNKNADDDDVDDPLRASGRGS